MTLLAFRPMMVFAPVNSVFSRYKLNDIPVTYYMTSSVEILSEITSPLPSELEGNLPLYIGQKDDYYFVNNAKILTSVPFEYTNEQSKKHVSITIVR